MINSLAEGRVFHELNCFIKNYDRYKYSFVKRKSDMDMFLDIMYSYRYQQNKLTNNSNKVDLYQRQLLTLARYYYYHFNETKGNAEATRQKMIEWISDFYDAMACYNSNIKPKNMGGYLNTAYPVPFFDNTLPFDAIINEAILAGELTDGANYEYPSPEGLPLDDGTAFTFNEGSDKEKQTNDFWLRQLNALCKVDIEDIIDKKKHSKSNAKNKVSYDDTAQKDDKSKYSKSLRLSGKVESIFLLALWYAENYQKYRTSCKDSDVKGHESRFFVFDIYRIRRIFMEYSSNNNLSKIFEDFNDFAKRVPAGKLNTFKFIYSSDNNEQNNSYIDCLPDISDIDNGYRLRETKITRVYSISLKMIQQILKLIPELNTALEVTGTSELEKRDSPSDLCFRFTDINKENLNNKLTGSLSAIAKKIADYFCCIRNIIMYGSTEENEELSDVKRVFFSILEYLSKDNEEKKKICLKLSNDDYEILKKTLTASVIRNTKQHKDSVDYAKKICSNNIEKIILETIMKLITNISKNESLFNSKFKEVKILKELINSFPEKEFIYILSSEDPLPAIIEITARMKTLIMMMFDTYDNKFGSKEEKGFIHWCAASYLCISDDMLEQEKKFREDILKDIINQ